MNAVEAIHGQSVEMISMTLRLCCLLDEEKAL